ncbi:MAG: plasmid replication, integration and excision activator [Pseudonocardia sp.]|nr:plasmid replication, integration and excision activator [Pseudonocardia sp.]
MAVEGRINVRHEDVFTQPVVLLSVDPSEDFDKRKAGDADIQERDKGTGIRLWAVSILDPTARQGQREIKVKVVAEQQPVPPHGVLAPCEFDGLQVIPYLDQNRAKPRVGIAYRATGFRSSKTTRQAS